MKVCLYLEGEELVAKSGFKTAFANHARALASVGVEVTHDPRDTYDLLHTHWFGPRSVWAVKQARRKGLPVVCHAHSVGAHDLRDSFTLSNTVAPLYDRYLRFYYNQADLVLTCSRYARRLLIASGVVVPIEVVSNGMDTERFRFDPAGRARFRRELNLKRFTFFSAGNLIPRKGVVDFLEVAAALPAYDFVWLGERWNKLINLNPELVRRLSQPPPNVRLPGFVRDTVAAFSAMDALFFPSYTENQPMTVLESATLGLPLIVRDIPEYEGFLREGKHCLKARDREGFVAALRAVAEDPALRNRLSSGARALAQVHALPQVGRRLRELYEQLIAPKAPLAARS